MFAVVLLAGVYCAGLALDADKVVIEPRAKRQPAASVDAPSADLRVTVPLVMVPVHVTTPLGASVTNLSKENFRIFEDNVEQTITYFALEDAPISIGLVFDTSGSMRKKMPRSLEATTEFFKTANPNDEFFLVEFSERPKLGVPFTLDSDEIYRKLAHVRPEGRTALLDAVNLALMQMKKARNPRRAIVILSDGGDNHSRFTANKVKATLRETDAQVYAMGIFDPRGSAKRSMEERNGPQLLGELAEETGGRHYAVDNLADLPDVCARIGNELRNQYVVGYAPANVQQDGKYHRVKVTLTAPADMPPLRTRYRLGYYSPTE
jgi:VWFA-related protein